MKNQKLGTIAMVVMITVLPSFSGGLAFAVNSVPMTPELAAKMETTRKQQEQRITPEKRKAAAEALKAERVKVYQARQAVQTADPLNTGK